MLSKSQLKKSKKKKYPSLFTQYPSLWIRDLHNVAPASVFLSSDFYKCSIALGLMLMKMVLLPHGNLLQTGHHIILDAES